MEKENEQTMTKKDNKDRISRRRMRNVNKRNK
jgi:hypothetical protein